MGTGLGEVQARAVLEKEILRHSAAAYPRETLARMVSDVNKKGGRSLSIGGRAYELRLSRTAMFEGAFRLAGPGILPFVGHVQGYDDGSSAASTLNLDVGKLSGSVTLPSGGLYFVEPAIDGDAMHVCYHTEDAKVPRFIDNGPAGRARDPEPT